MKIEIKIGKEREDKEEMNGPDAYEGKMDKVKMNPAFHRKVAKLLAKAAGRKEPNMVDIETAADFIEDNEKQKSGMED